MVNGITEFSLMGQGFLVPTPPVVKDGLRHIPEE